MCEQDFWNAYFRLNLGADPKDNEGDFREALMHAAYPDQLRSLYGMAKCLKLHQFLAPLKEELAGMGLCTNPIRIEESWDAFERLKLRESAAGLS